jgi:hypothetical protein
LEKLLGLLSDNVWHSVDEVAKALDVQQSRFQEVIKLLAEAELIHYNPATNQLRLNQNWENLVAQQKETSQETQVQSEAAVGTIIIPPQKTLIIQCTRITNLTDNSLELEIRVNKKLSEIAISRIK